MRKIIISTEKEPQLPNTIIIAVKSWGNCIKYLKGIRLSTAGIVFFDKYSAGFIDKVIPNSLPLLKEKLIELLQTLEGLDRNKDIFGVIHFDFNDGNYSINYDTGQITVYDFDNSCYCWYMYDLADLWTQGAGWIQFEPDAGKRKSSWTIILKQSSRDTDPRPRSKV
ncbi:phosphotransferase [Paenibacillus sp. 2TAB19]|uniref:phosphotransferase n=1 Tax=Paenibacillus sp. 2TAB19 TaxID=3233003 RepID=UPI003F9AD32C